MSTTSVPDGLRQALQPEYLKLYFLLAVGVWLLSEDSRAMFAPLSGLGDAPIIRNVILFLSTILTLLSVVLVVASIVGIAIQIKTA
jgi:hypothetical protein